MISYDYTDRGEVLRLVAILEDLNRKIEAKLANRTDRYKAIYKLLDSLYCNSDYIAKYIEDHPIHELEEMITYDIEILECLRELDDMIETNTEVLEVITELQKK